MQYFTKMHSRCIILDKQKNRLLFIVGAFWFAQYIYVPYQVTYLQSLGYTSAQTGVVVGAYGFVQIFMRVPFGLMADHAGKHKKIIILGLMSVGVASLIRIVLPNLMGYFFANLFSGIGASAWISYMVLYLSYYGNDNLQGATGKVLAANNTGVFLGFLASTAMYAHLGMKAICAMSVLSACMALVFCAGITENPPEGKRLSYKELLGTGRYKRLIIFSVLALLQQGVQMATVMSFTVKAIRKLGAQGWQIGMASIIYIVFAVLFAALSSCPFFSRIGYRHIVPAGLFVQMLYCILVPVIKTVPGIYGCQILASAAMGFLFTALTNESMKGIPENRSSSAMGYFQAIYAIGMTVFPIMTGAVADALGLYAAYRLMAALLAVGLISSVIYYRKERQNGFCR